MRTHMALMLVAALALPAGAATAQTLQLEPRERLLSMTGDGAVRARPDTALITLGVVSEDARARAALDANNSAMQEIRSALRGEGLESNDLQTSGFSIEPVYSQQPRNYDQSQPFRPEIVAYRVRNNLTVRIRDLERVGGILDQVITLGANSVSGPVFTVDNPKPLEDQARRAAMRDALRKGALYAQAADVALGPIFRIEEGAAPPPQPLRAAAAMRLDMAESTVPIESGELTFEAQVSVSWLLAE